MKEHVKKRSSVHASHVSDFNSASVLRKIFGVFHRDSPPPTHTQEILAECMMGSLPGYLLTDSAREFRMGIQHILETEFPGYRQPSLNNGIKQPLTV